MIDRTIYGRLIRDLARRVFFDEQPYLRPGRHDRLFYAFQRVFAIERAEKTRLRNDKKLHAKFAPDYEALITVSVATLWSSLLRRMINFNRLDPIERKFCEDDSYHLEISIGETVI